jgi:hypothetical protein
MNRWKAGSRPEWESEAPAALGSVGPGLAQTLHPVAFFPLPALAQDLHALKTF